MPNFWRKSLAKQASYSSAKTFRDIRLLLFDLPMSTQVKRRIVTYSELKPKFGLGYCYVHICRLEKAGRFPKKVRISANRVGWFEDEILQMLEERAAER